MSIRKRTILAIVATVVVLFTVVYGVTYKFLLDGFIKVENDEVVKNVLRLNDTIKSNIDVLSTKADDWGRWDDPYQFIVDRNEDFIESNLGLDSIRNLKVNLMAFVSTSSEVVVSRLVDLNESSDVDKPLPEDLKLLISGSSTILQHPTLDHHTSGIVMLRSGPMLISARTILTSSNEGPAHGTIILGRYLDAEMIKELSMVTHLEVKIEPKDQGGEEVVMMMISDKEFGIERIGTEKISGFTYLYDIYNQPILEAEVVFDRAVYQQGLKAVRIFSIFYFVIGLVFIALIVIILERLILDRLTLLSTKVDNIRTTRNLDQSVGLIGSDEFAKLSRNIDDMLTDLRVAQKMTEEKDQKIAEEKARIEEKNETLEHTQRAVLNVLEDLEIEKKKIEETVQLRTKELTEEKAKLEASISSLPVGFAMIGTDHQLLIHNEILGTILDCKNEDISFGIIKERFKDSFDLSNEISKIQDDGGVFSKNDIVFGNKFIKLFLAPVSHTTTTTTTTEVLGFLLLVEDITDAKMLERTREEFFAVASHELRTPLTAIRGNMAMIKDFVLPGVNNPDLADMVNDSYNGAVRLIAIVNDFLDASRLEQGKVQFKIEPVDVGLVVEEVSKELEAVVLSKKLKLSFEVSDKDLPKINADRDRVKQIIFNLVGNAVNYTREGGVTIKASTDDKFVKIAVTDSGVGISEINQQRLFKKFQQAQGEVLTRDMTKSTGLGLYISKMLAERMGGNIALDKSELGKGSTFSVNFPIAVDDVNKV